MITILIKVKPNSGKDEILIDEQDNLSVKIKAKPIAGEANEYLIKYLAKELGLSKSAIQLEKGATSRLKKISINIEPARFQVMLDKFKKR